MDEQDDFNGTQDKTKDYPTDYIKEVLEVYRKLLKAFKTEKMREEINQIFPFGDIFSQPELKGQFDKIMKLLLLALLETWKDMTEKDKLDIQRRLEDESSWGDEALDPKEEWKYFAVSLGLLGNPELSATKIAFPHYLNTIR